MAVLVGRISVEKDMELALDVAGCLFARDERWRVVFVGASFDGPTFSRSVGAQLDGYAQSVKQRHAAMAHPDRVVFAGQRDDALAIIADADVLYSTSKREGFPNVVLEAMCGGTPVVSTAYSDIRMILPNEWQVVGSRDPGELADAIERARREAPDLTPRQRQWVLKNATIAHSAAAMLHVYERYART
jgi:glycosyltransferase involved in cell wall biosynthesis